MLLHDQPIQKEDEDILSRTGFAHHLAQTILEWKQPESIVIGLMGSWGTGKTSVLNLAVKKFSELTKHWEKQKQPVFVWFNPWNISDKDHLLKAFLEQILSGLYKVNHKHYKEIKKKFEILGKTLGALEDIPTIGKFFKVGGNVINLLTEEKSLVDQKADLDKLFLDLNRQIIIIIDDIDRLTVDEIRLLFQIIKINADFPNTIYLIAFDREVVEKALTTDLGFKGRDYLEKIIQVGFNIPKVDVEQVHKYLFSSLETSFPTKEFKEFDVDRWGGLIHHGFLKLFSSIRDVKRYMNSLILTLDMISTEVNPIDFIGLEAIRVFLPEVYQGIAENKHIFLYHRDYYDHNDLKKQENKKYLDQVLKGDGEEKSMIAIELTKQLFPQLSSYYSNIMFAPDNWNEWRKNKRICSDYYFDTYFLLGTTKSMISQAEVDLLINTLLSPDQLSSLLQDYINTNRLKPLINHLRFQKDKLERERSTRLLIELMKILNNIPDQKGELFDLGSDLEIYFLIEKLLCDMDSTDRYEWFLSSIQNNDFLYSTTYVLNSDTPREARTKEDTIFSEAQFSELKTVCVKSIEHYATAGILLNQKDFTLILYRWNDWSSNRDAIAKFIENVQSTTQTFIKFAAGFIRQTRSQTAGRYTIDVEENIYLDGLFKFIPEGEINGSLQRINNDNTIELTQDQAHIVKLLTEALEKKRNVPEKSEMVEERRKT